jgi:hypothetical protein
MKSVSDLQTYFGEKPEISLEDLREYFQSIDPDIPDSTVNWRVHDMIKSSILHRTGRGQFELGSGRQYLPELNPRVMKILKFIQRNFSDITYCAWNSDMLNEFAQHLTAYPFIVVDVEKEVAESVYYSIKEHFNGVFLRPSELLINDLLPDFRLPIIIRHLISESPINEQNNLPLVSLEKILVDVFCDMEFKFLAGGERRAIFRNAYYKYTINENKLLRYAARKGRRPDIHKYIKEGGFAEQKFKPI